jgi:hypothetical protein
MPHTLVSVDLSPVCRPRTLPPPRRGHQGLNLEGYYRTRKNITGLNMDRRIDDNILKCYSNSVVEFLSTECRIVTNDIAAGML